jgi:hypothetical protein
MHAGKQHGGLVAEGDRHRVLEIAARHHGRVTMAAREIGERARDRLEILLDERERGADLHHGRGVGDVLRRRAPVAPFAEPVSRRGDELLHDAEHRVADALRLRLQLRHVDRLEAAVAADLVGRLLRNDAKARLHERQRGLNVEVALHPSFVRENGAHLPGAEDIAEEARIDDGRRHAILPSFIRAHRPFNYRSLDGSARQVLFFTSIDEAGRPAKLGRRCRCEGSQPLR